VWRTARHSSTAKTALAERRADKNKRKLKIVYSLRLLWFAGPTTPGSLRRPRGFAASLRVRRPASATDRRPDRWRLRWPKIADRSRRRQRHHHHRRHPSHWDCSVATGKPSWNKSVQPPLTPRSSAPAERPRSHSAGLPTSDNLTILHQWRWYVVGQGQSGQAIKLFRSTPNLNALRTLNDPVSWQPVGASKKNLFYHFWHNSFIFEWKNMIFLGGGVKTYSDPQWLNWFCEAGGLTWRSQVGASPIPIPTYNLALFRRKITFYRFNQAGLDWPLCHCAMAQPPSPFDEHRHPLAPSKFFSYGYVIL